MRRTKIICTMGPSTASEAVLEEMCRAGMDVARLNFSHGSHKEHLAHVERLRRVRERLGVPLAILLDTRGPECRIGCFRGGRAVLREGARFVFTARECLGDEGCVSVSDKQLCRLLKTGDRILVGDGLLAFTVEEIDSEDIVCRTDVGGEISDRKSMSFPMRTLKRPYLGEKDKEDLLFGVREGVDYFACSFVSSAKDLLDVKKYLQKNGCKNPRLIAKIENRAGVAAIDEILEVSDGIMIARGDMGVEIPYEELPAIQKRLIAKCRLRGKRVITATEMLESMIRQPRPTRAEISDVANAVYDGTSALMLSGETAAGKDPPRAVSAMARIAARTEESIHYEKRFHTASLAMHGETDAITHAVCAMAIDIGARAVVISSLSGHTARSLSRFRPPVPILALCTDEGVFRALSLSFGVLPVMCVRYGTREALFEGGGAIARRILGLSSGDKIILTGGELCHSAGTTDTIRILTL